jgi:uncharacterized protein (TIGR03435 family)
VRRTLSLASTNPLSPPAVRRLTIMTRCLPVVLLLFQPAFAQPTFDAASIKPSTAQSMGGGFNLPAGRLNARNRSLRELIQFAYDIHEYQLTGGPGWMDTDRYEVVASAGGQSNTAEKRLMLQKLLADRFGLVFHAETREVGGYALTIAKGGPKLHPPASDEASLMLGRTPKGLRNMIGKNQKTSGLIMVLADLLDHPVLDATGLTGSYDFYLEWAPEVGESALSLRKDSSAASEPPPDGQSIFTAVQEQLGLKLESRKAPIEIRVVDRAEKPALE